MGQESSPPPWLVNPPPPSMLMSSGRIDGVPGTQTLSMASGGRLVMTWWHCVVIAICFWSTQLQANWRLAWGLSSCIVMLVADNAEMAEGTGSNCAALNCNMSLPPSQALHLSGLSWPHQHHDTGIECKMDGTSKSDYRNYGPDPFQPSSTDAVLR